MRLSLSSRLVAAWLLLAGSVWQHAQQGDPRSVVQDLDRANQSRFANLVGFSDTEHYMVYRGKDTLHLAAEMTVRSVYKRGVGKSYQILSESGSPLILKYGLHPLIENEKAINDPAKVAQSWFTSANYAMEPRPAITRNIDGQLCFAVAISPYRKAPNLIEGTLWVELRGHMMIAVEGLASKSPSVFAGATKVSRQYGPVQGYAMATHARAESNSAIFGRTVVLIDYTNYQLQLQSMQR